MAEGRLRWCADALVQRRDGAWLASNARTHSHVELDATAFAALAAIGEATEAEWLAALDHATGWDRTGISLEHGLWSDPTGLVPRRGEAASGTALLALLRRRRLVVGDDYEAFLAPMASIFDRDHLGTFHQRIGQHVTVDLRVRDKWRWWHDSKFTPDGANLREGPYKWVQERFFDRRFDAEQVAGRHVLDFACGNGYFARKFARLGARVTAIDTAPELIAMARRHGPDDITYLQPDDPKACLGLLRDMPASSVDRVYMSDILLLLFDGTDGSAARELMAALSRLLVPGGELHLCEPNPLFWLSARLGDPTAPTVAVTEYRKPLFNGCPTLDLVMAVMAEAGLGMVEFVHPDGAGIPDSAPELKAFAARFPLWDFLTFSKLDR